ncbi:MAG: XRE family transcriptional regulator [Barnesiella sp.]|nr:XRE family transcriptional regulator [Bacteroidales bacterium]MBD5250942.1 XRE family transcriptional regulator [Barnesiella sp.]MBD5253212.1 XRE family transcriptional regulator [Barnesiella sp.]
MTFKEIYEQVKTSRPKAPAAAFVKEVAAVTKKSEVAVRRWLCNGESSATPDALTQEVLARHFNTTPEELFPQSNN